MDGSIKSRSRQVRDEGREKAYPNSSPRITLQVAKKFFHGTSTRYRREATQQTRRGIDAETGKMKRFWAPR